MYRFWRKFLAFFRLSLSAVCEESRGMCLVDFHDYQDGILKKPWHFYIHTCRRCGKQFSI